MPSNKDYLSCVLADPRFAEGETTTSFLKELDFSPHGIEVVDPGMNTTVQVTRSPSGHLRCLYISVCLVVCPDMIASALSSISGNAANLLALVN